MSFIDVLLSGTLGQIAACNLADSLELGLVSPTALKKVLRVARRYAGDPRTTPRNDREAVGLLVRAIVDTNSHFVTRRLPKSLRPDTRRASRRFATVIPRWWFVRVFKRSALNRNLVYLYRSQPFEDADFTDIEALNGKADVFELGATIGYKGPVWLADAADCNHVHDIDRLRDLLGLVHRRANEPLISIEMPGDLLTVIKRPSALDAGARGYRSVEKSVAGVGA